MHWPQTFPYFQFLHYSQKTSQQRHSGDKREWLDKEMFWSFMRLYVEYLLGEFRGSKDRSHTILHRTGHIRHFLLHHPHLLTGTTLLEIFRCWGQIQRHLLTYLVHVKRLHKVLAHPILDLSLQIDKLINPPLRPLNMHSLINHCLAMRICLKTITIFPFCNHFT